MTYRKSSNMYKLNIAMVSRKTSQ